MSVVTPLVPTAVASAATGYNGDALDWGVGRGHFTAPEMVDGAPMWDLERLRRELGAYRRRCRGGHPRWSRRTHRAMQAEAARRAAVHDIRARSVVQTELSPTIVQITDGFDRYLGCVMLGDTLLETSVWLMEPPSRVGHANTWDLPWARTRVEAVRRLAAGECIL